MNHEQTNIVTQAEHAEWIKVTCTMATLSDAIDDILHDRPELRDWFDDYEN